MKLKQILLACLFMQACQILHAQYQIPTSVPTPIAADLGKFGSFPVSYYTGRAEVSIPLYTMNVKGVEMPVTLSYDTSGILVNSLPGWVGQNWSLNAGGVITRVINGTLDEYCIPAHKNVNFTNYFNSYNVLPGLMQNSSSNYQQLRDNIYNYRNDMEPDVFCFNFMGKTGRFFLGNDGEWKILCDENLDIVFDVSDDDNYQETLFVKFPNPDIKYVNEPKTIKGFTIRDENGTQYVFGGNKDAIDYSINLFGAGRREDEYSWAADSWYLTKVMDRYNNTLYDLTYERGCYIVQLYQAAQCFIQSTSGTYAMWGHYGNTYTSENYTFPYSGMILAPVYLKEIKGSDGTNAYFSSSILYQKRSYDLYGSLYNDQTLMYYDYMRQHVHNFCNTDTMFYCLQTNKAPYNKYQYGTTQEKKMRDPLASMSLKRLDRVSFNGNTINYIFNYNTSNCRFHLSGIRMSSEQYNYENDNGYVASYTFKYNNMSDIPQDYLSSQTDHWGYYNGTESRVKNRGDFSTLINKRKPNPTVVQTGMLKEIVFPTGGTNVIEYEPNDFSKCMTDDRQAMRDTMGYAGGVRVKSITEYDDESHSTILKKRTFSYQDPNTHKSSGQILAAPRYIWKDWCDNVTGNHASSHTSLYRSVSIIPLANSFSSHIGYSYVKETFLDGTAKEYHFSNFSDFGDNLYSTILTQSIPSPYDKFGDKGYKRGKLKSVGTYDSFGQLLQTTAYTYTSDYEGSNYVWASSLLFENYGNSGAFSHYIGRIYKMFYPKYDISCVTTITKYGNKSVSDQTQYQYRDYSIASTYGYNHNIDVRMLKKKTFTRRQHSISEE